MPIDDAERERRRVLLHAHYEVENDHDLDRIMATFSTDGDALQPAILRRPGEHPGCVGGTNAALT